MKNNNRLVGAATVAIRIVCVALAIGLVGPLVGFHNNLGAAGALVLGALSVGMFSLSQRLFARAYGVAPHTCPLPAVAKKLYLSVTLSTIVQMVVFSLLPFVTMAGWWTYLTGAVIVLAGAFLSNFPTRLLSALTGGDTESDKKSGKQ